MSELNLQSGRDAVRGKPEAVYTLLCMWMVKATMGDPSPDLEKYSQKAMNWWNETLELAQQMSPEMDEENLAEALLEQLNKQPVWGRILRNEP